MWEAIAAPIIGSVVGGLFGGKDKQQSQTQTNEPWAPAQPYILDNLKREQQLQNYYQKTPFNPQQIQGYSNLFADTQNFRDNVMPGLLNFANRGMTSNYQRSIGPGASNRGLLAQQPQQMGAFSMPKSVSLLDLNGAQNPFAAQNQPAAPAAPSTGGFDVNDPENAALLAWVRNQYANTKRQDSSGGGD